MKYTLLLVTGLLYSLAGIPQAIAQCPIPNGCTPGNATNSQAALFGGGIFEVKIGDSFTNTTPGASEGYRDFCSLGPVTISMGTPVSIRIRTGNTFSENLRVYVDLNNDQVFTAPGELFFSSNNSKIHIGTLNFPSGVTGQSLKLRVTSDLITSTVIPGPCTTPEYSQVEDYAIILQENVNPPQARFNVSDTLTCSGTVSFTDQSVNNPTSWLWSFGDGQTSTLQNPVHQYSTPGTFSVKLKVSNGNGVDSILKSNLIRYNDTVPAAISCKPLTLNQCCGYGISRFALHTIDNSSSLGSYQDFTCTHRTTLLQGRSYSVQIGTNPNQNQDTRIWIDYNNNAVFENSELVFESLDSKNPTGTILISGDTAVKRNRALRLRVMSEFTGGPFGFCSNLDKGQCEDYTVYLQENTQPPVANFSVNSPNFCLPNYSFISNSLNLISLYHWYFGDGTDTITLGPNVNHTYSMTGSYDVKLLVAGPFGVDSITKIKAVTYFGPPVATCSLSTQAGGPQFGTGIAEVKFGGIFHRTGNSTEGYQNYTCSKQTTVFAGQKVPITIRNSGNQVEKVRVWIDWSGNGNMEETELVFSSQGDTVHTGLITIPPSAQTGATLRMRVGSNFQNAGQFNACGTIQLGQAEDYGVVVVANTLKPVAQFSADKPVSCTGIVQFSDTSANLPQTWEWNFGDGQTSSLQNPVHSYSSTGSYTVKLKVSNDFGADSIVKTNYVQVSQTTGMVAISCAPEPVSTCCGYGIGRFQFAGINQTSGPSTEGYQDFTCGPIGSAEVGAQASVTILNSGLEPENVAVWVDWNNDGSFANSELAFSSSSSTSHSGTINIPANAPAGLGLRVRVKSDFTVQPIGGPCQNPQFGQVEDYQIRLTGNTQPPIALFAASETVSCSGSIQFVDTSFNAPGSWWWSFGDGDTSTLRNPTHTYTSPGIYTVTLIARNVNGSDTLTKIGYISIIEGKNLKPAPCMPQTNNTFNNPGVGISRVRFNSINRSSGLAPAETYVDASCEFRTNVFPGQNYSLNVNTSTNFAESCRVWIDWNNNGQFEDPAERVLSGQNSNAHSATVLIPSTAPRDTALRMRVMSDFGGGGPGGNNIQPCNNLNFGQCEDYAVVVLNNNQAPSANPTAVTTTTCNGYIQFRDSSAFLPTSWLWSFGDGSTSTLKDPLHQYTSIGTFSVTLRVRNANGADSVTLANFIQVTRLNGPRPASCINTVQNPSVGFGTTRVRFGTLDKTSNFSFTDGGYVDYTCSDSALVTVLTENQNNNLIVNTSGGGNRENVRVYIDFNNDGTFSTEETVLNSTNNVIHSANLVLTQDRCLGIPVRMRVITDNRFNGIGTSCYNPVVGQVEDYAVRLVWAVVNTNLPVALVSSLSPRSCNGYIQFRDSSQFNPTSWLWDFGDGTTSTLQNPLHQYPAPDQYTVKLKVTNSNGSDSIEMPNYVLISGLYGAKPINCFPTVATPSQNVGTLRFRFGAIDKTTGPAGQDGGYLDYTCSDTTTIRKTSANQIFQLLVNTVANVPNNCRVYIDFNDDGVFGTNESVVNSQNSVTHGVNLNLRSEQCSGTLVRIRVITESRFNQITSPCYNPQQGQVEDYAARLIWEVPNNSAPVASILVPRATTCNGFIQFQDNSQFFPTSWFWNFGDGETSTEENPLHQYTSTGTFDIKLKVTNANGADSIIAPNFITVTDLFGTIPAACVNSVASVSQTHGTSRVRLGSLDKTSNMSAFDGGYLDYTCSDTGLVVVTTANPTPVLTINTSSGTNTENCNVYLDFNNNGVFSDNELVLASLNSTLHTRNLNLTPSQCLGVPIRMRVITDSRLNSINTPCYNPQFGQVEDYTIRLIHVLETSSLSSKPDFSVYPNPSSGILTLRNSSPGLQYWKVLDPNGRLVAAGSPLSGSSESELNLSFLPSGVYHLQVQSETDVFNQRIVIQK